MILGAVGFKDLLTLSRASSFLRKLLHLPSSQQMCVASSLISRS